MADVTLTRAQYESLLAAASGDTAIDVLTLRETIDDANGIRRYFLRIRWQDLGAPRSKAWSMEDWPPEQQRNLELDRPITLEDVNTAVLAAAVKPAGIMVSLSRVTNIGWTALEDWDFNLQL